MDDDFFCNCAVQGCRTGVNKARVEVGGCAGDRKDCLIAEFSPNPQLSLSMSKRGSLLLCRKDAEVVRSTVPFLIKESDRRLLYP